MIVAPSGYTHYADGTICSPGTPGRDLILCQGPPRPNETDAKAKCLAALTEIDKDFTGDGASVIFRDSKGRFSRVVCHRRDDGSHFIFVTHEVAP